MAYLADIDRIRGAKAAKTLREDVNEQWRKRKNSHFLP